MAKCRTGERRGSCRASGCGESGCVRHGASANPQILDDGSIKILFYPEEKERSAASKLWGTIFYR